MGLKNLGFPLVELKLPPFTKVIKTEGDRRGPDSRANKRGMDGSMTTLGWHDLSMDGWMG
jgi:hypothetical protein